MTNIAREIMFETSNQVLDATTVLSIAQRDSIDLFGLYERARSISEKQKIAEKICASLLMNIQIEEEIFHPAIKKLLKEKGVLSAVIMEHSVLKYLITEIESLDADSSVYDIKIKVLGEYVKDHIVAKQTKLFPKVNALVNIDIWGLGNQLAQRKEELQAIV